MKTNQEQNYSHKEAKEAYEKPQIEVIEMEMESSILAGGGGDYNPGGGTPW
ncbi:hypothetical protein [Dysgonomonas termitidis]|uniref:Uncharacterized protein n=1 Tax=Dysgonomonas termitidis TaxID=1516126 RepID=A0ABV9KQZ5_9BACT